MIIKHLRTSILLLLFLVLAGSLKPTLLETIKMQGGILMVTMNSPTTYYQGKQDLTGFEYELANSFARDIGVKLKVVTAENRAELFGLLKNNPTAFVASGIMIKDFNNPALAFAKPYMNVSEQVICLRGTHCAKSNQDLLGKTLMVTSHSNHTISLREQQVLTPKLSWQESPELEAADLLELVATGQIDYTVVNSNEYDLFKSYFPNLKVAFNLTENAPLSWVFDANKGRPLQRLANEFMVKAQTIKQLAKLNEKYYGHVDELDYVGAKYFLRQTQKRLGSYKKLFQTIAQSNQQDWRMLAAISYQESHWRPLATSFTGVRGMMMLTRATAKHLGVEDRLNSQQSVAGGSRYLLELKQRLQDVKEPDRTWLALAAYNIGYLHLKDARILTEFMGGNPNSWLDIKENLPLLAQKKYYKKLQYGFARGYEAVDYVQNIRRYYDILVWHDTRSSQFPDDQQAQQLVASATVIPPLL